MSLSHWAGSSNRCRISPWRRHHIGDKGSSIAYRGLISSHFCCCWLCTCQIFLEHSLCITFLTNFISSGYIICAWVIWFVGNSNWCGNKSWLVLRFLSLILSCWRLKHFNWCIFSSSIFTTPPSPLSFWYSKHYSIPLWYKLLILARL